MKLEQLKEKLTCDNLMELVDACYGYNGYFERLKVYEFDDEFFEFYDLWQNGKISSRKAAKHLNVSYQTFLRWTNRMVKGDLFV